MYLRHDLNLPFLHDLKYSFAIIRSKSRC